MDKRFEASRPVDTEIPVSMHYERAGKSRLLPAYLRGCLHRFFGGDWAGVHKPRQSK